LEFKEKCESSKINSNKLHKKTKISYVLISSPGKTDSWYGYVGRRLRRSTSRCGGRPRWLYDVKEWTRLKHSRIYSDSGRQE